MTQFSSTDRWRHYAILRLDPSCGPRELQRRYREMALERHPDKLGGDTKAFQELLEAYEALTKELQGQSPYRHARRPLTEEEKRYFFTAEEWEEIEREKRESAEVVRRCQECFRKYEKEWERDKEAERTAYMQQQQQKQKQQQAKPHRPSRR
ncbi:unnamed protein product [Vitrella brassicaformis CCMP3155]|uniref:J domain-containing protein n=1 Tax=Vitrella brassicaformis (strain CCMP3155) TaxID=1169540 RepID=A0A0G4EFB7_VITBC|nr:unnamed protein product [Vitrella brassicaformis CCMP3155]|eukprot:CEL94671.1 unnamed protein product [Vitrella brassicaformis CCMP3155]